MGKPVPARQEGAAFGGTAPRVGASRPQGRRFRHLRPFPVFTVARGLSRDLGFRRPTRFGDVHAAGGHHRASGRGAGQPGFWEPPCPWAVSAPYGGGWAGRGGGCVCFRRGFASCFVASLHVRPAGGALCGAEEWPEPTVLCKSPAGGQKGEAAGRGPQGRAQCPGGPWECIGVPSVQRQRPMPRSLGKAGVGSDKAPEAHRKRLHATAPSLGLAYCRGNPGRWAPPRPHLSKPPAPFPRSSGKAPGVVWSHGYPRNRTA